MGITKEGIDIMNERNSKIGIFLIFLFALALLILPKYFTDVPKTNQVVDQRKVFEVTDDVLKNYSGHESELKVFFAKEGSYVDDITKNNSILFKRLHHDTQKIQINNITKGKSMGLRIK